MSSSLRSWLGTLDRASFDVEGTSVVCWFGDKGASRRHTVRLAEDDDALRLEATVAGPAVLEQLEGDPIRETWRRNRLTNLVGFRIDSRGRLIAEATAPLVGLRPDEFEVYVRAVASEADRLELILTGRDLQ